MLHFFSLKYWSFFVIFTLIWGAYLGYIGLPYFMISVPIMFGSIYILGLSFKYYIKYYRTCNIVTFSILFVLSYIIATIIKISFISAQFDFLRKILWIIGAISSIGSLLWISKPYYLKKTFSTYIKYLPYVWIFVYMIFIDGVDSSLAGNMSVAISFAFFLPKSRKWIPYFALCIVFLFPGQRMALLRIILSLFFYIIFKKGYLNNKITTSILVTLILIFPYISFITAVNNIFNPFNLEEIIGKSNYGSETFEADTRTFLYEEAINSAVDNNYVLFGRTLGYGYDSPFQTGRIEKFSDTGWDNHELAQRISEVFIVNIFTWMGVLGIIVFSLLFFTACYWAITKSRNKYMLYISLLTAIQWIFCWIENPSTYITFDLILMWIFISMCFNPHWLNLDDRQFEKEMRFVFNYKLKI